MQTPEDRAAGGKRGRPGIVGRRIAPLARALGFCIMVLLTCVVPVRSWESDVVCGGSASGKEGAAWPGDARGLVRGSAGYLYDDGCRRHDPELVLGCVVRGPEPALGLHALPVGRRRLHRHQYRSSLGPAAVRGHGHICRGRAVLWRGVDLRELGLEQWWLARSRRCFYHGFWLDVWTAAALVALAMHGARRDRHTDDRQRAAHDLQAGIPRTRVRHSKRMRSAGGRASGWRGRLVLYKRVRYRDVKRFEAWIAATGSCAAGNLGGDSMGDKWIVPRYTMGSTTARRGRPEVPQMHHQGAAFTGCLVVMGGKAARRIGVTRMVALACIAFVCGCRVGEALRPGPPMWGDWQGGGGARQPGDP